MTTLEIIRNTKAAWGSVRDGDAAAKNHILTAMADSLTAHTTEILQCNALDMDAAKERISEVMLDRLRLDEGRIAAMADGIRATVKLPDHTGRILSEFHHANGMTIYKKQVPLGLVAIIYESRPNVTSDAAALAIKSGNVCVLRGGKEAYCSAAAIVAAMHEGLRAVGLPEARLPLAQAIIAICESPKSNSVCAAVDAAMADAEKGGYGAVPVHLRDTHYAGHDRIGSGDGYKYPHDYPGHYVRQNYMPVELQGKKYYFPSDMGHEATIRKNQEIREGCK